MTGSAKQTLCNREVCGRLTRNREVRGRLTRKNSLALQKFSSGDEGEYIRQLLLMDKQNMKREVLHVMNNIVLFY